MIIELLMSFGIVIGVILFIIMIICLGVWIDNKYNEIRLKIIMKIGNENYENIKGNIVFVIGVSAVIMVFTFLTWMIIFL